MTKKICVIGNSHVGALKLGWEQIKDKHSQDLSFLGVPGIYVRDLAIQDGKVVPTSDTSRRYFAKTARAEAIELDRYDAVVMVAGGLGLVKTMALTERWRPYWLLDERTRDDQTEFELISDRLFRELVASKIRRSFANRFVRGVARQSSARPLYVMTPLPSSEIRSKPSADPVLTFLAGANGAAVVSLYRGALEQVMGKRKVVLPPAKALVDGAMTDIRYSRGSLRLDGVSEHPDGDLQHMNADYGALMLEAIFSRLSEAPGTH